MVVRPYRVRYRYDEWICYCEHPELAVWLVLYARLRMSRASIRAALDAGTASAQGVSGWYMWPRHGLGGKGVYRWATNEREALVIADTLWTAGVEITPVDELYLLEGMDDLDLAQQCVYVWGQRDSELIKRRVPHVPQWLKSSAGQREFPMTKFARRDATKALRLALELPWYGASEPRRWPDGQGLWQPSGKVVFNETTRLRLRRLHRDYVPLDIIHHCTDVGLSDREPVHGAVRDQALRVLARAYGYHPGRMSDSAMFCLFCEGPTVMEAHHGEGGEG